MAKENISVDFRSKNKWNNKLSLRRNKRKWSDEWKAQKRCAGLEITLHIF